MSEQEWGKGAIFEPGIVRRVAEEPVQVERPIEIETARQISPPVPGPKHVEPRAVLDNPQLVELWRQINAGEQPGDTSAADQPPDEASAAAQMCMALYLLQGLHGQGKPEDDQPEHDEKAPPPRK
jgi:hypothetical protein